MSTTNETQERAKTDDLWRLLGALHKDVLQACADLGEEDTPYNRRALVRAAFASIEAVTHYLKQDALQRDKGTFSPAEVALLLEESYTLNNGKAVIQRKFLPLEENFPFAIAMFSRAMKAPFVLEKGEEWAALKRAIEVRNRIIHPKRPELLEVTDEELEDVRTAYGWVVTRIVCSLGDAVAALHSEVQNTLREHGIEFKEGEPAGAT